MSEFGYITLALNGRPYAELAHNLAASIRASHFEAKIAVITNMGDSFHQYSWAFDEIIQTGLTNANKVKTQIYDLTPFKKSIFIDADSMFIWLRHSLKDFENRLIDCDLSFPVLGRFTKSMAPKAPLSWVNLPQLWTHYGFGDDDEYQAIDSSLFYFKKSRKAQAFFKKSKGFYGDYPHLISGHPVKNFPDEIAFSIAATKMGHSFGELDNLTYRSQGVTCNRTKALSYPWLSMPGDPSQGHKNFYNALAKNCGPIVGASFPFRKT